MFFNEIGKIQLIRSQGSKTIIIYYRFYDALVAIEFFRNPQNFKDEMNKDNFSITWLQINSELNKNFPDDICAEVFSVYENYHNFYKDYFMQNNMGNMNMMMGGMNNMMSYMNSMGNMNNSNMNYYNQNSNYNGSYSQKDNTNYSGKEKYHKNYYDDEVKLGKYTCRFEILLDNDKDFQIARKLIGAKGCNMKKIVESCGSTSDGNDVKLRLRGRGSGYKEGPYNRESDDPLHLCISSKQYNKYQQACGLVEELINSVNEEYKKHCNKYNKTPLSKIYVKIEEGISSRKSTQGTGFLNQNYDNM
jgi:hypothetical protein